MHTGPGVPSHGVPSHPTPGDSRGSSSPSRPVSGVTSHGVPSHPTPGDSRGSSSPSRSVSGVPSHGVPSHPTPRDSCGSSSPSRSVCGVPSHCVPSHPTPGDSRGSSSPSRSLSGVPSHAVDGWSIYPPLERIQPSLSWSSSPSRSTRSDTLPNITPFSTPPALTTCPSSLYHPRLHSVHSGLMFLITCAFVFPSTIFSALVSSTTTRKRQSFFSHVSSLSKSPLRRERWGKPLRLSPVYLRLQRDSSVSILVLVFPLLPFRLLAFFITKVLPLWYIFEIFIKYKGNCQYSIDHTIHMTENGLKPDPAKAKAVEEVPVLTDMKAVQRFLGFVNYWAKFIPDMCEPLRRLTSHDKARRDIK